MLSDFEPPFFMKFGNLNLPIYTRNGGDRCVVVLHELPGMTPSFVNFCRDLSDEGYKVYMPLIFKEPFTEMNAFQMASFCVSSEFRKLFNRRSGEQDKPFTNWLLELCKMVSDDNPSKPIGMIGMCLTGNFAVASIIENNVKAAVACQPSYPFFTNIQTLGLSEELRRRIATTAGAQSAPCVKAYRYKRDWRCRERHMRALEGVLGDAFDRYPDLPGGGHSTLTGGEPNEEVYADCLEFLSRRLN